MSGNIAWGKFVVWSTVLIGGGYTLMRATTPNEKEFYDSLAPDLKRKVDAHRLQIQQEALRGKVMASDPDAAKPVWVDSANKPPQ